MSEKNRFLSIKTMFKVKKNKKKIFKNENLILLKKEENNKNKSNKLLTQNCKFYDNNLNVYDDESNIIICKFCDQHCHGKTVYLKHVSSHTTKEEKFMSNPLIIITKS